MNKKEEENIRKTHLGPKNFKLTLCFGGDGTKLSLILYSKL